MSYKEDINPKTIMEKTERLKAGKLTISAWGKNANGKKQGKNPAIETRMYFLSKWNFYKSIRKTNTNGLNI